MIKVLAAEPRSKKRSGDEAFGISRKSLSTSTQYRQLRRLCPYLQFNQSALHHLHVKTTLKVSSNLTFSCCEKRTKSRGTDPTTVFCEISVRRSKNCLQFSTAGLKKAKNFWMTILFMFNLQKFIE